MRCLKFAALLACASLAACQPPGSTPSPATASTSASGPSSPSGGVCRPLTGTVVDERALYAAEAAYNVPAHAYVSAEGTGRLPANVKAVVKSLLQEAYRLLRLAREAYCLGDFAGMRRLADSVKKSADDANKALPPTAN